MNTVLSSFLGPKTQKGKSFSEPIQTTKSVRDRPENEYPTWGSTLPEGVATKLVVPLLEQAISGAAFLAQSHIHFSS